MAWLSSKRGDGPLAGQVFEEADHQHLEMDHRVDAGPAPAARLRVGRSIRCSSRQSVGRSERRVALHHRLPGPVVTQCIVIIEIFVAEREPVKSLPEEVHLPVGGLPRTGDRRVEGLDQPHSPIGCPQQQHAGVAGDVASAKARLNFTAIEAWKTKIFPRTIWH